ncbi:MAG: glycosyltransferase family 4 protein [Akkermansiaceae bacterium]
MNITYDSRIFNNTKTGIWRYSHELISELKTFSHKDNYLSVNDFSNSLAFSRNVDFDLLPFESNLKIYVAGMKLQRQKKSTKTKLEREIQRIIDQCLNLPLKMFPSTLTSEKGAGVYHSTFIPFEMRHRSGVQRVITIHDLIPHFQPTFFDEKNERFENILKCAMQFEKVICVSESTAKDLKRALPDIDAKKIFVTPLAASSHFKPEFNGSRDELFGRHRLPRDKKIMLSVCTLEPRKNLQIVIRIWKRIQAQFPDWIFVVVGGSGWGGVKAQIEAEKDLRNIYLTGYIPDADLCGLYALADLFVYPSLYEGFGLPVLEAMQSGLPVVVSNTSSIPEVVGDDIPLVNPTSEDDILALIVRLMSNESDRLALSKLCIKRAGFFSWRKTAQLTLDAYNV